MLRLSTVLIGSLALAAAPAIGGAQGHTSVSAGRGPQVIGSNRFVSQRRPVGHFRVIEVRDASDVQVRVGPAPSLVINADDNILPVVRSAIRDQGKLVIDSVRPYRTRRAPRITITVPQLSAFALRGSGNATIEGVNGRNLALALAGSGDIRARGRTGTLTVALNGSGDVDASQVSAGSAAVVVNGSGDALVRTSGPLTGVAQGSGSVRYIGRPSTVVVRTAGSGSVEPAR